MRWLSVPIARATAFAVEARRRIAGRSGLLAVMLAALILLAALGMIGVTYAFGIMIVALTMLAFGVGDVQSDIGAAEAADYAAARQAAAMQQPALTDESWRLVIDALPEPAVALDRLGNVAHSNSLMREMFPRTRDGVPFSHVSRHPELMDAIDRADAVGQRIVVQLVERVPVDRRISVTVSRLTAGRQGSASPSLLLTFRDLSEQDKLDQMRADFVANASHELRTPLASLRGFVETLQGPARDDPVARQRFLGLMASQSERMTRLIDDLLSLSRVEMRAHLPPRGVVDLNEVVAYVAQTLEPLAKASGITLKVNRLPESARVRGDRDEVVQVFQNLMQNAIKYGKRGGTVDVRIDRTILRVGAAARLSVAVVDDGQGIAPEHLPRLTERFYRVNAASSREKGGTGLGLAIVKHIVLRHRGELRISSRPGEGSRFVVDIDELPGNDDQ